MLLVENAFLRFATLAAACSIGAAGRREDWGDPAYDAAVAQLPVKLRGEGVKISKLVVIGVSYSGFTMRSSSPRIRRWAPTR